MKADPENHHLYNKKLKRYARRNRNQGTKAEACLWKYALRKKQASGYSFKRQRPVMNYIADFMCQPLNLIIEVDGSSHDNPKAWIRDRKRDAVLRKAGFTVLRFTNDDVLKNIDSARNQISRVINEIERSQARHRI